MFAQITTIGAMSSPVSVQAVFYGFKDIEVTIAGDKFITTRKLII